MSLPMALREVCLKLSKCFIGKSAVLLIDIENVIAVKVIGHIDILPSILVYDQRPLFPIHKPSSLIPACT